MPSVGMPGARRLDGKVAGEAIRELLKPRIVAFSAASGRQPGLGILLAGDDGGSEIYVRNKVKACEELGIVSDLKRLPESATLSEVLAVVDGFNRTNSIDGVLVQSPLPVGMGGDAEQQVFDLIDPAKDVDGFHISNVGLLGTGQKSMVPCTPLGCLMMLRDHHGTLSGMDAVVIGRSNIVGKPMAQLLLNDSCTVTIAHSRTKDLAAVVRRADIVIAAVGRPEMVPGDWIKPGATIIDVGINRLDAPERGEGKTRLVGDVDFDSCAKVAGAITPVPGAAGLRSTRPAPMTPRISWTMVLPVSGTSNRFRFASSVPFWMARGTSLAFP